MIHIGPELLNQLRSLCQEALPGKAYGILAGRNATKNGNRLVTRLVPLTTNLRPCNEEVDQAFASFGEFYAIRDRGFFCDPGEQAEALREIKQGGEDVVAIYHSHRCLCATPSHLDVALHWDPGVLSIIVSVMEPNSPEVRAFRIADGNFQEVEITTKEP